MGRKTLTPEQRYAKVTDLIINELENGNVPWHKPWTDLCRQRSIVGRPYHGINAMMLTMTAQAHGYESTVWLTYRKGKEFGGYVKEHGTPVSFWKMLSVEDKKTGKKKTVPMFRTYTVFNVDQFHDLDLTKLPKEPEPKDNDPIAEAEAIVKGYVDAPGIMYMGGRAFYRPSDDSITVPVIGSFDNPEEYYSTLFHEMGHSTGHSSRLKRNGISATHSFGDPDYSKEELVAEFTAAFLCAEAGIHNTVQNSAAYIKGWLKALKNDRKLLVNGANAGSRAAQYILQGVTQ